LIETWGNHYHSVCTIQLFSSLKKQGVEEAEKVIGTWLFGEEPEDLVRKSFALDTGEKAQ
jgi:GTP-binding protein